MSTTVQTPQLRKTFLSLPTHSLWGKRLPYLLPAFLPLIWAVAVTLAVFTVGTAGFQIEKTQESFIVSRVNQPFNPVQIGDRIIRVYGVDYHNVLGYLLLGNLGGHDENTIVVRREGETITLTPKYMPLTGRVYLRGVAPYLLFVLLTLTLSFLALLWTPEVQPTGLFVLTLSFFTLIIVNQIPIQFGILHPALQSLASLATISANWLGFSAWAHFALRFPAERQLLMHRPLIIAALYWLPPVVTLAASIVMAHSWVEIFGWVQRLRRWSVPLIITGIWVKHGIDYQRTLSPLVRNQLRLLLTGGGIGISVYLFLYLLPNLILDRPLIPFRLVAAAGVLIPLSCFLSIIRYRLLDVDQMISNAVTYVLLIFILMISYSGALIGLKRMLWGDGLLPERIFWVYILIIAILFNPLKNRLQHAIDRLFFREKIDYRSFLHDFSKRAVSAIKMPDLIDLVVNKLPEEFGIQRTGLMVMRGQQGGFHPQHLRFDTVLWNESALVHQLKEGDDFIICQPDHSDTRLAGEMRDLWNAGFRLVLKLKRRSTFLGMLCLGEKKSCAFYTGKEIQVLFTLANQIAIALENALIYGSLEESKAELQQMFDKVVQSEKMAAIGEMTALLAHEIKNPLGVIRSSAQYLVSDRRDDHTRRELLNFILDEVDSLNMVVNNLLGLARYKPPEFKPVDMSTYIKALLDRWRRAPEHNPNISLSFRDGGRDRRIFADRRQLSQVFLNLIQNSEDAMPEGGFIAIELEDDSKTGGILLRFRDNGTGIAEEHAGKVFKKFFTTKEKGLGLGLSVCKQVVSAHNGTIEIVGKPGEGVTVSIALPERPHGAVEGSA